MTDPPNVPMIQVQAPERFMELGGQLEALRLTYISFMVKINKLFGYNVLNSVARPEPPPLGWLCSQSLFFGLV